MKIGDEVYVHGYVDEIRKDVIIIRNEGGYFGTSPFEIVERFPELKGVAEQIKAREHQMAESIKDMGKTDCPWK